MRRWSAIPPCFVVGEEIGVWGGAYAVTQGLLEKWGPDRIVDTPIAEAAIAGLGIGAALTGSRPVAEFMYSDFMGIAMDQIVNQAAKNRYMFGGKAKLPLTYRAPFGAGTGNAAQHTQSLEAWFAHVPGLKVITASTPYDAKGPAQVGHPRGQRGGHVRAQGHLLHARALCPKANIWSPSAWPTSSAKVRT